MSKAKTEIKGELATLKETPQLEVAQEEMPAEIQLNENSKMMLREATTNAHAAANARNAIYWQLVAKANINLGLYDIADLEDGTFKFVLKPPKKE